MLGGIVGDIAGSRFERSKWQGDTFATACCVEADGEIGAVAVVGQFATSFELFHADCFVTDDTAMTIAVMDWLLGGGELRQTLRSHFRAARDPNLFGKYFRQWASSDDASDCGSVGNGAAMRVAPVAMVSEDLNVVRELARQSAIVTHAVDHAIAGAEAIAASVFLARKSNSKALIKAYIETEFGFDLNIDLDQLRSGYEFSSDCRTTVPIAIAAFLASNNHEETVRRAISVGGDTDTIACMAGSIAGCCWQVSELHQQQVMLRLDSRSAELLVEFE